MLPFRGLGGFEGRDLPTLRAFVFFVQPSW